MGGTWWIDGERRQVPPARGTDELLRHARRMLVRSRWDENMSAFWRNVLCYYLNKDGGGSAA